MSKSTPVQEGRLCNEDFELGDWWRTKARSKTKSGEAVKGLSAIVIYEYARESSVLRSWDEKDHTLTKNIQEQWSGVYPFLWVLRFELAMDKPWLKISRGIQKAALDAGWCSAPSYFSGSPSNLRLAFSGEIERPAQKLVHFESWAKVSRRPVELIAFKIDWKDATNAELAESLAFFRPHLVPEPKRSKKQMKGRKKPDHFGGGLKSSDYFAALKYLTVLRLAHEKPEFEARNIADERLGISSSNRSDWVRCLSCANDNFSKTFGWLDKNVALSAKPFGALK